LKKIRCTLRHFIPLSNLFPSLVRRFACCQSCSVSLRTLWAYGFDNALQRAFEKLRLARKKKLFFFQPTLLFKKQIAKCHQDWRKPPFGLGLDGLTEQSAKL